jgi:hypothetical protein
MPEGRTLTRPYAIAPPLGKNRRPRAPARAPFSAPGVAGRR